MLNFSSMTGQHWLVVVQVLKPKCMQMKRLLFLLLMAAGPLLTWAQRDVTGRVTDSRNGTPIVGASVTVKGSRTGTTTDQDGRFRISVASNAILVVSNVGFADKEVTASSNNLNVTLKQVRVLFCRK